MHLRLLLVAAAVLATQLVPVPVSSEGIPDSRTVGNIRNALLPSYRLLRDAALNFIGRSSDPEYLAKTDRKKLQKPLGPEVPFPCPVQGGRSPIRPRSVHELRPGDIDVVGAIGDSLTAGNGAAATNILQVYTENRGVSWTIGGQGTWRQYLTVPNILKEFNPRLVGYSLKDSLGHHRDAQFNAAEIAAMARDTPFMARRLVQRIVNDPRVNVTEDWKLVSFFIGCNDICVEVCYMPRPEDLVTFYREDVLTAMRYLRDHLPRTLVQIMPVPDLLQLTTFAGVPADCKTTHIFECPCLFGTPTAPLRKRVHKINLELQQVAAEIAEMPEFNSSPDFAIVMQPVTKDSEIPKKSGKTDFSFMSTDCFHFSQKGYARMSNSLWNNMLQPVGQKGKYWNDTFSEFLCPSKEMPYIFTNKNSKDESDLSLAQNNKIKDIVSNSANFEFERNVKVENSKSKKVRGEPVNRPISWLFELF